MHDIELETQPKHTVRMGVQNLTFQGTLLAESSSRVGNRPRWVEFRLYRTTKGTYVLSRVGVSIYFHSADCSVVSRNKLKAVASHEVPDVYVPCPDCNPAWMEPEGIYPETPRYWALHDDNPEVIIENLQKYDKNKVKYLTHVASRLLVIASRNDEGIKNSFYTVNID
jgi:hypothetical protein